MISHQKNVIRVVHPAKGDAEAAKLLTDELRPIMRATLKAGKAALLHDTSQGAGANEAYLRTWGAFAKEFRGQFLSVAIVPKAWVRVLAKTVVTLSGIDLHVFKTEAEANDYLRSQGFTVENEKWRVFTA